MNKKELRKEIIKVFHKINKDLMNNGEDSMTIYDVYDFYYKDNRKIYDNFTNFVYNYVNDKQNGVCEKYLQTAIRYCDGVLLGTVAESLNIENEIKEKLLRIIDEQNTKYLKSIKTTPIEELIKDNPFLQDIYDKMKEDNYMF